MPTLSRSPRHHSPHPQTGACRKESCVPPTGEAVFLWGQFEKEGRAAACGHCPQGPGITGTLPRMRLFTFPVPKPPQHTREEAGRDTETARGDMARERLGTSPLIRLHVQSQIPMRHCRPCRVRTLIQVKATWAPPAPACGEPGGMALPCSTPAASPRPLTLLNWKRSRLSLSRAGSCPGLRNRLILLSVQPSAERGRLLSRGRGEHTAPEPGLAPTHCSAEPRPPWASLPKPRRWPPLGQASSATLGLSKLHLQTAVPLGTGGTLYLEAWACCL